jgi:hypothetical protein
MTARCRFAYLLGINPRGGVFFFADSEQPTSADFSPPGQLYPEASPMLLNVFRTGKPVVEGPISDRWGIWVSGFVPVGYIEKNTRYAVLGPLNGVEETKGNSQKDQHTNERASRKPVKPELHANPSPQHGGRHRCSQEPIGVAQHAIALDSVDLAVNGGKMM